MARVPYLEQSDLAPDDRDVLERRFHLWQALANSPQASRHFQRLVRHLWTESGLDRRLLELVILQVGYVMRAEYEWLHHIRLGLANGLTREDILAIGEETAGRATRLAAFDRLALRATREMTQGGAISAEAFAALSAELDPRRLVNLTLTMALYNGVVRLLPSLAIEVEDEYRDLLQQFPLPPA